MKIAVLGYYGHLNFGDDLLQRSLTKLFIGHELVFWNYLPSVGTLNTFDHVVFGGGSIWPGAFIKNFKKISTRLKTPFSLLGISSRQQMDFELTKLIVESALITVVRDQQTKKDLYDLPEVIVAPDLSWLYPLEINQEPVSKNVIGINLRKWSNINWEPKEIVSTLQRFANEIKVFPFYLGFSRGNERHDGRFMEEQGLPFKQDLDISNFYKIKILIGMRFHSLVLALQTGIPIVAFDYHPKVVALTRGMGLSKYCISLGSSVSENLLDCLLSLSQEKEYDELRDQIIAKRSLLIQEAQASYYSAKDAILSKGNRQRSYFVRAVRKIFEVDIE